MASGEKNETIETEYSNKISILAEVWLNYRSDEDFEDFVEYNDLGLPLAYMLENDIVKPTAVSETFINETFSLLLALLEVEDIGFENLEELLDS